jgi:MFS family permease
MAAFTENFMNIVQPGSWLPSVLRNRDFRLLWSGQFVSGLGSHASDLAFPLLLLSVTHSAAQTGLLVAAGGLSNIVLPLPVGVLVDRWDRKKLMILSDFGRAVALGSIPLALTTGHLSLLQLAVVTLAEGALQNVFSLAGSASLLRVVTEEELGDAIALGSVGGSASGLLGPSIGGLLFTIGRALPFLVDSISYTASALSLLFMGPEFQQKREAVRQDFRGEIRKGVSWLWHHPVLRFLACLVAGLNFFSFGYQLILIVRAQELHAGAFEIGLLFAIGGVGGILGSLAASYLQRRFTFGTLMVLATWGWALTWIPYALAPNLATLFGAYIVGAPIVAIFLVVQSSYQLRLIPDEVRGRVNSVFRLLTVGLEPLSITMTGILLQAYGGVSTILIVFAPQVLLAALTTLNPRLRRAAQDGVRGGAMPGSG